MSTPGNILDAVAEDLRGHHKRQNARLANAAGLVREFTHERSLGALDAILAAVADPGPETRTALHDETTEIQEQAEVLDREVEQLIETLSV